MSNEKELLDKIESIEKQAGELLQQRATLEAQLLKLRLENKIPIRVTTIAVRQRADVQEQTLSDPLEILALIAAGAELSYGNIIVQVIKEFEDNE